MNNNASPPPVILASSSPYRQELLTRLQIPFICESPDIDESTKVNELPGDLVTRLARKKVLEIAGKYPASIIIGSDQVAVSGREILGKPGNYENAHLQLRKCSDQSVVFYTGLCVMNTAGNSVQIECITFTVKFRKLDAKEIDRYLEKEKPYNCAGAFKSEGLGISLIEYMQGEDPTALIGLPLIQLCSMLRHEGIEMP